MNTVRTKSIKEYSYDLPDNRIAYEPVSPRDSSKLLQYRDGIITDHQFSDIINLLNPATTVVVNNSSVIPARIILPLPNNKNVEIFLLEPLPPVDYNSCFESTGNIGCTWKCFVGGARKWKAEYLELQTDSGVVYFRKQAQIDNYYEVNITWQGDLKFFEILFLIGKMPLPPYINRATTKQDEINYQTVYNSVQGSVAAPTAGLHFTNLLWQRLAEKGTLKHEVTLHVGAGTFAPVKSDTIGEHQMHAERFSVRIESLKHLASTKHVTAVGTTSMRTLESLYWMGVQVLEKIKTPLALSQWACYEVGEHINYNKEEAFDALYNYAVKANMAEIECSTSIMIVPGYKFKVVDELITNFHQPNSTLLLLVNAFVGESWRKIYEHALQNNYRFLSFGDSSILSKMAINM
jgi:S-adenosylmethionine:tRNA ribosyltransferase-isomerase